MTYPKDPSDKGYTAYIEFDEDAGIFHGEVIDTKDVITFQGTSVTELKKAFPKSPRRPSEIGLKMLCLCIKFINRLKVHFHSNCFVLFK